MLIACYCDRPCWPGWRCPLTLLAVIDDWFLRPRRRLAALPAAGCRSGLGARRRTCAAGGRAGRRRAASADVRAARLQPGAGAGGGGRRHSIWLRRSICCSRRARLRAAQRAGVEPAPQPVPVTVDYARSFLPVAALVLVVRAFIFEPFRIPSDSMMPTLERRRFHRRQQVRLRPAPAGAEPASSSTSASRSAAMWWCFAIRRIRRSTTSSAWSACRATRCSVHDDQLIINGVPVPMTENGRYPTTAATRTCACRAGTARQAQAPDAVLPHQRRPVRGQVSGLQPRHGAQLPVRGAMPVKANRIATTRNTIGSSRRDIT